MTCFPSCNRFEAYSLLQTLSCVKNQKELRVCFYCLYDIRNCGVACLVTNP